MFFSYAFIFSFKPDATGGFFQEFPGTVQRICLLELECALFCFIIVYTEGNIQCGGTRTVQLKCLDKVQFSLNLKYASV